MSERQTKIKRLGIILTVSIVISLTIDVIINSYVFSYFFGTITLSLIGFWIIVALIDFYLRANDYYKKKPMVKIIEVNEDGNPIIQEELSEKEEEISEDYKQYL